MRTNITFAITGASHAEIEYKLRKRIAKYLGISIEEVDEKVDIEIFVYAGEQGEMELTFTSECKVKVKKL
jgi:hypothetical protein